MVDPRWRDSWACILTTTLYCCSEEKLLCSAGLFYMCCVSQKSINFNYTWKLEENCGKRAAMCTVSTAQAWGTHLHHSPREGHILLLSTQHAQVWAVTLSNLKQSMMNFGVMSLYHKSYFFRNDPYKVRKRL